ncbi:uncharacterized protein L203_102328 [Cryptococcus depauperatus CBS 7841]|uniref:Uncharacterized protein n=1 Tax=Cryptococcus depauperatus CBS 7841 TaxID=1295531 RepID=A0AAJ8M119_9TREE
MTLLSKPSRSYAHVEHDKDGLGSRAKRPEGFKTHFRDTPQTLAWLRSTSNFSFCAAAVGIPVAQSQERAGVGGAEGRGGPFAPAATQDGGRIFGIRRPITQQESKFIVIQPVIRCSGVADITRAKSKRQSAFGSSRRHSSSSSSSSQSSHQAGSRRPSMDVGRARVDREREEEEVRKRLEKQRMDDVSSYVARRRSLLSEREQTGRGSPSIRSSEDLPSAMTFVTAPPSANGTAKSTGKSQQVYYYPSPLSPSFPFNLPSAKTPNTSTFAGAEGTPPEKATEMTLKSPNPSPLPMEPRKSKVEVKDGTTKIIGFDGPLRPSPLSPSVLQRSPTPTDGFLSLRIRSPSPSSTHLTPPAPPSASTSHSSGEFDRSRSRSPLPHRRATREGIYPETPAQTKKRQEKEQRRLASGGRPLVINTDLVPRSTYQSGARGRVLPEIEIVEDDDPRIILPREGGKTTRIPKPYLPFPSHSSQPRAARKRSSSIASHSHSHSHSHSTLPSPPSFANLDRPRSLTGSAKGGGGGAGSLVEDNGGYLPSRWASGDRHLRVKEADREAYRPKEWGKDEGIEWHPGAKDQIKRNLKDIATSASGLEGNRYEGISM